VTTSEAANTVVRSRIPLEEGGKYRGFLNFNLKAIMNLSMVVEVLHQDEKNVPRRTVYFIVFKLA
jgi:hypothetical protein